MSEVYTVDINKPKPHPENARKGDVPAIMRSLERFGQVKPIVVQRSTGYVVAGNHVLEAAKRLGWDTIQCIVMDVDDEKAKAYLIADNRTGDKATYNKRKLLSLLGETLDLDGTGFDIDDVETLTAEVAANTVDDDTGEITEYTGHMQADGFSGAPATRPARAEPTRDILMLMSASVAQEFGLQIIRLQQAWGTTTVVDTVRRAVAEAVSMQERGTVDSAPDPIVNTLAGVEF